MTEVILLERIEKLGITGDVVTVRPGYARNFLIPMKKALRATKENIVHFESQRAHYEAHNIKLRDEARKIADKMEGLTLTLIRQAGETGHLYGSVSSKDIAVEVSAAGFDISGSQVALQKPIKELGVYTCRVILHADVDVIVTLNIARTNDDAQVQLKKSLEATAAAAELAAIETPAQ